MKVQLLHLLLISTITTIAKFAGGELFLQMPLTINPVIQEVITERGPIVQLFLTENPDFFSRLSPVDMVTRLDYSLSHVIRKTISGAVVLGLAAMSDGLAANQLHYKAHNKWTVNVSLTDIRAVLTTEEEASFPFTGNTTLAKLQNFGLRVLQQKYNISLKHHAKQLHSSNATTYKAIEDDWIKVVKFITATSINRLAARHGVNVETLAETLNYGLADLYNSTLGELDKILSKELSFEVSTSPTTATTTTTTRQSTSMRTTPTVTTKTTIPPETIKISLPTVGSETTGKLFSTKPSGILVPSSAAGKPTEGKSKETINLALFVGVAVGLLLLFVASSSIWCFRRKRRNSWANEKMKNNNGVKMNNLWLDKTSTPSSPEEANPAEELRFVRNSSISTLGVDSRFKELRYNTSRPSSSTFSESLSTKVPISRNSFLYDHRREIFV